MQVSSFPVESRKHLTSGWEQKLCCVSSDPPGTSLVNAWTWHLFTPSPCRSIGEGEEAEQKEAGWDGTENRTVDGKEKGKWE